MELPTSSRLEKHKSKPLPLGKQIGRYMILGLVTLAGAALMIVVVLGILFFSGESTEFIYMNF
ncbi:hypothetical protein NQ117_18075 [Paenibacillus sp. SC116]|uniref:hypothetical protein n=1 Tax=Paenibacillus sp. SC116 TaxID=2968986 RepID=UPI00215AB6B5|nr:hypothetical protein [Paenibacillus sp. SC116]MCR8845594.1 hypothetical protein [Paenibacillus sp. SC116]